MNPIRTIKDLPYANYNGRELRLDLFIPTGQSKTRPAILWVRGGGWRTGDKNCDNPGAAMAAQGFVAAVLEYRGSAEAVAPGNVHDCKAAVRWLRANAGTYGIDPDRIGAAGESAGGHLVALLGATAGCRALEGEGGNPTLPSSVQAVCDFCGPTDLTRMAHSSIRKQYSVLSDVTVEYLGGPVEQRLELARLVSPLNHASPSTAPTLMIHGDADTIVPVEESIIFYDSLKKFGVDATLHRVATGTHELAWATYGVPVMAFFRRTLTS